MIIALLTKWIESNFLMIAKGFAIAISILALLFGVYQFGRNKQRNQNLTRILETKNAQLRATVDSPRSRAELINILRKGKF